MQGQVFKTQDETLIAAKLIQRLDVKNGKLFLDKKPIIITLPGEPGENGVTPKKGVDYDDGKDGYTPVKGKDYRDGKDGITPKKGVDYKDGKDGVTPVKGQDYFDGKNAKPPAHRWSGTCLSFQNPDGTWGEEVDLKGVKGDKIKGDRGDMPNHEWSGMGKLIRFENPDGSWDLWANLQGEPGKKGKGLKGDSPVKGIDYKDGEPGKDAELPVALDLTILVNADLVLDDVGKFSLKKKFAQVRIYPKG
jgi:hypothetical protein